MTPHGLDTFKYFDLWITKHLKIYKHNIKSFYKIFSSSCLYERNQIFPFNDYLQPSLKRNGNRIYRFNEVAQSLYLSIYLFIYVYTHIYVQIYTVFFPLSFSSLSLKKAINLRNLLHDELSLTERPTKLRSLLQNKWTEKN